MLASDLHRLLADSAELLRDEFAVRRWRSSGDSLLDRLLAGDALGPSKSVALVSLLANVYGDEEGALEANLQRLSSLSSRFLELYGDGPISILRAPARINILGEHVDYVSYLPTYSLPFGSREHDMLMLYRSNETGRIRGASTHEDYPPFFFSLGEGPTEGTGEDFESDWLSYLFNTSQPTPHWGNYVKGSCFFACAKFGSGVRRGYDFLVASNIPPKGGASSSSALVVLAGAAIRNVNNIEFDPLELALDSSKAEWFVGTRGGSMDHLTICLAERSHAVHISYRDRSTHVVPLPAERLRWVTFFSHPADKGKEIMLEYNERAAVSRLLIPAIIEGWRVRYPQRYARWRGAIDTMLSTPKEPPDEIESLLTELPETITLGEVESDYVEAYQECVDAFPALVTERRGGKPLRVRSYAIHHFGEVSRVSTAARFLETLSVAPEYDRQDSSQGATLLGSLLTESHISLRDLYEVSTPEVEALTRIILADENVYGARLMGGGFGGNVLALTTEENVPALVRRVQTEFYDPRSRDASSEGSIMISTPGVGLSELSLEATWRQAILEFNALGNDDDGSPGNHFSHVSAAKRVTTAVARMLDLLESYADSFEVWPVIVAAGKGSRARESGLDTPKPVAPVNGVPTILGVLRKIKGACGNARTPIVIVSPETEAAVRHALRDEDVLFVTQSEARGTGDAVLQVHEVMKDFRGRALIIWSTQPVIRQHTIARTLNLAALFSDYDMIVPTSRIQHPYSPVERNPAGHVVASRETHLEGAAKPNFGETNIGMFVLESRVMFSALIDLRKRYWLDSEQGYDRARGELGFPNEMINYLAERKSGVLACPFADGREAQGIKTLKDVRLCERLISELEDELF